MWVTGEVRRDTKVIRCEMKRRVVMNTVRKINYFALLLLLTLVSFPTFAAPIGPGNGKYTADLPGLQLVVFTYRPSCPNSDIFWSFMASIAVPIFTAITRAA